MSSAWARPGAWAKDAEAEEQLGAASSESQSFPSLKEAAAAKPKKKKGTTMALSEFNTGTYVGPGGGARRDMSLESKGLTPEEMLRLPSGPKERSAEELEQGRMGGGFRDYSRSGMPPGRTTRERADDGGGSWGGGGRRGYGGFDDEQRGPSLRASDVDQPSRADEVENWASTKKPISMQPVDAGRQDRHGSFGGSVGGGSRADETDNWAAAKRSLPSRSRGFGSGFRDSNLDPDRWRKEGALDGERERPRLVIDRPRGDMNSTEPPKNRPNPFGAARPREEILAGKGLDWKKLDLENGTTKTSRPPSSQSSRPPSAHSTEHESPPPLGLLEGPPKPRPKLNPFGDAKPRELVLQEKGKDWRKMEMELEHRAVDRPESEDEKMLKEDIYFLRQLVNNTGTKANVESTSEATEESMHIQEQILTKERDLEQLTRKLDDKVRFGEKASDRPGSGAGRIGSFSDRTSQPGLPEETSMDIMERPHSHTSDVWTRPEEDGLFRSGRERGFFAGRDFNRPKSRERW